MYGGVRGRKTKVGEKLLRFPPTRLYGKGEGKGGCPEGEGLPIYDGIYFCLYLFSVVII